MPAVHAADERLQQEAGLTHLAQTGHILRLKNRPGNVHDSTQAAGFLRALIDDLRARFGRRVALEFRMDAASFQRRVFRSPDRLLLTRLPEVYWGP